MDPTPITKHFLVRQWQGRTSKKYRWIWKQNKFPPAITHWNVRKRQKSRFLLLLLPELQTNICYEVNDWLLKSWLKSTDGHEKSAKMFCQYIKITKCRLEYSKWSKLYLSLLWKKKGIVSSCSCRSHINFYFLM